MVSTTSFVTNTVSPTTGTEANSPGSGSMGDTPSITMQDDLGSVLGKLGLDKYHPLFQVRERERQRGRIGKEEKQM